VLDFLTKHVVILSSMVIVVASAISMLFLAAYLAVFDWSLIWLIEYTDLAKLFLIGTALLSSVISLMLNYLYNFIAWLKHHQTMTFKWAVIGGLVVTALGGAYSIYYDVKTANDHVAYHSFRLASTFAGIFLIYLLLTEFEKWRQLNWLSIVNDISFLVLALGIFGAAFGYYVKDVSKDFNQITTKNEAFENSKIVVMFSHHLAFVTDSRVVVVPTADLVKIVAQVQDNLHVQ
jgi:hypothetical protein